MRVTWQGLSVFLATGFGVGYCPKVPGTAGTLLGVVLYFGLSAYPMPFYIISLGVMLGTGAWLCEWAAKSFGDPDPKEVVWDEMTGYLVAMAAAPRSLAWMAAGFVLFRLFDILKPGPIGWAERRFSGGVGIMLDDLLAGVFTLLALGVAEWTLAAV